VAQFGSRTTVTSSNLSAVQDPQGNLIVSPDNSFGASPLGIAARTQALYGIPNANFNLLPDQPGSAIETGNELPYWQINNTGSITATMQYDDTNQTWAVRIDPSAAGSGDSLSLTTRSYLLNDSNLSLRQKAFASITKVGTQATSQWNLVMTATYYDHAGSALSTYAIGTANSGTTWTTINGFTTSGTAAINAAAQYLDLDLTLTTTTAVTGTAKVDLTSVLLQTSTGGGASQSFLVTQEFTTSGTFIWPTGVDYLVAAVGIGAGQGGGGGRSRWQIGVGTSTNSGNITSPGGNGGGSGPWVIARDIPRGTSTSLVIGIAAGGAGGAGGTATKAAGTYIADGTALGATGGYGGVTTIGNYYTLGSVSAADSIAGTTFGDSRLIGKNAGGLSLFGTTVPYYPYLPTTVGTGQSGGASVTNTFAGTTTGYTAYPSTALAGTGVAGSTGSGGNAGLGSAGKTGTVMESSIPTATTQMEANNAGGGAGRTLAQYVNGTARTTGNTITMTASNGGSAAWYGAGGGGGGGVCLSVGGTAYGAASNWTLTSGNGGNGAPGYVVLVYVA